MLSTSPHRVSNTPMQQKRGPYLRLQLYDREIFTEVFSALVLGVVLFTFILLLFQANRLSNFVIIKGIGLYELSKFILYISITVIPLIIPIAFLFSVLKTFSRLSAESELIAYLSCGISKLRLCVSVFVIGAICAGINLSLNLYGVPWANKSFNDQMDMLYASSAVELIRPREFISDFYGVTLYADSVDSKDFQLFNVLIKDERSKEAPLVITAKRAALVKGAGKWAVLLRLLDGNILFEQPQDLENIRSVDFSVLNINLLQKKDILLRGMTPLTMPWPILLQALKDTINNYADQIPYLIEYHKRIAVSLSSILFAWLGIVFGITKLRAVKSRSAILACAFMLLYFLLYYLGTHLSSKGYLHVGLSMWLGNIVIASIAGYKTWRNEKGL